MVRYGAFIIISLIVSIYCLWSVSAINSKFNRLIILMKFLFQGNVDPTLLDSRVVYECSPLQKYSLSTLPQDVDAL